MMAHDVPVLHDLLEVTCHAHRDCVPEAVRKRAAFTAHSLSHLRLHRLT